MSERKHKAEGVKKKAVQTQREEEKGAKGKPVTINQRAKLDTRLLTPRDVRYFQATIGNRSISRLLTQTKQNASIASARPVTQSKTKKSTLSSPQKDIQRAVPDVQRAAPVLLLGLTAPELASVVGVMTGVAAAIGMASAPRNNMTGMGDVLKLVFDGDYLMPASSKTHLEQISRALFFMEMEKLMASSTAENAADEVRQTAVGNVKQLVFNKLDAASLKRERTEVANGAGGRTKSTPWGSVKVRLDGGTISPSKFNGIKIYDTAKKHDVDLEYDQVEFIKSCLVTYDFKMNSGIISDDDIFVRGQDLNYKDDKGSIKVECTVAFDWDVDTTYYVWQESNSMSLHQHIPEPKWVGETDPND